LLKKTDWFIFAKQIQLPNQILINMTILDQVQTLSEIQKGLADISQQLIDFSNQYTEEIYFAPFGEKWSMAGNLEHLILTNTAMSKTFSYPKEALAAQFGKAERPSLTGPEIIGKYLLVLGKMKIKAPPAYSPQASTPQSKTVLLKMWDDVELAFQNNLKNWSDEDLDTYRIPHPAMGNLNLREMVLFAIYHTNHHLKAMKKIAEVNA
jgi:DNA-directed RNA polymerase subunit L